MVCRKIFKWSKEPIAKIKKVHHSKAYSAHWRAHKRDIPPRRTRRARRRSKNQNKHSWIHWTGQRFQKAFFLRVLRGENNGLGRGCKPRKYASQRRTIKKESPPRKRGSRSPWRDWIRSFRRNDIQRVLQLPLKTKITRPGGWNERRHWVARAKAGGLARGIYLWVSLNETFSTGWDCHVAFGSSQWPQNNTNNIPLCNGSFIICSQSLLSNR